MDKAVEENIRGLAQPLWESAARPYGMAMDFWLMAEQMVLEMMAASARMQHKALSPPPPPTVGELPSAAPVAKVRALAECMWDSAGRQYGMAQDYWLSAERHVLTMMRAATALPPRENAKPWAAELCSLEPSAYLERIRLMAYYSWEAAGRRYGQALDYWLNAEREILSIMAAVAECVATPEGSGTAPIPASPSPREPAQVQTTTSVRTKKARPKKRPRPS
jgi:Protein of unknown function (DUF2934)